MIINQRICFPNCAFNMQMYQHVNIENISPKAHADINLLASVILLSADTKKTNKKQKQRQTK